MEMPCKSNVYFQIINKKIGEKKTNAVYSIRNTTRAQQKIQTKYCGFNFFSKYVWLPNIFI